MKTIEIFEPGDVVVLKSDGPKMTVEGKNKKTGYIICCWFNMTNDLVCSDEFSPAVLKNIKKGV